MLGQHVTPVEEFAGAMLEVDDADFAARVDGFESRFGTVDAATLGLLAQAAYFCDVHCDHPTNLFQLCEGIGKEAPSSTYLCGQISQDWWDRLHHHVVAGQRWAGVGRPVPKGLDAERIEMISGWLGPRDEVRRPLVTLFLDHLIDRVLGMNFTRLGRTPRKGRPYVDYSDWYVGPDGRRYPFGNIQRLAKECKAKLREVLRGKAEEAERLVGGIMSSGPPPCVCKFTRYLDIQAASIGALAWRGNLPAQDELTSFLAGGFLDQAKAALGSWRDGLSPPGDLAERLHESLGSPTERKKAIVFGFLNIYELPGSRGCSEAACDWLARKDDSAQYHAARLFSDKAEGASEGPTAR